MNTLRLVILSGVIAVSGACGSNSSPATAPTSTPTPTGSSVTIPVGARTAGSAAFMPNPVTITAGSTVTWTNNDSITHTVTSDSGVFDSGNIAAGGRFSFTFNTRGTFPYHCTPHPTMVASVVVQ